ncbi:MAG: glycosyltransferase, partial [Kiritimatiellae bacterium]|nr:glycosyltransferase [Kiritimatiellia bacterium]
MDALRQRQNPLAQALSGRRVALGHDWLTGMRGGERVLELFCEAAPSAPLVTLVSNPASVSAPIRSREIVTSFMQRIPGAVRNYRRLLPLMPLAATTARVPDCDLFLTTNSCVAHAFRPPRGAKMVCYCFTPMRYAWLFPREYLGPAKAALAAPYLAWLRRWDKAHTRRVDRFIAISRHVQRRIRDFYGRDSAVVYPPVDAARCTPAANPAENGGFDLVVSALVPYKRIDLAVRAYARSGYPLKVVGVGSAAASLQAAAAPNVEFLGWRSDDDVLALYRQCRFLLFPGEEDYGIVPTEAMACGKPVVAFGKGGATET